MKASVPWPLTVFVLVMLPVVTALGFWQLDRAEQKLELETAYLEASIMQPRELAEARPFAPVTVVGRYAEEAFLVDNQVLNGRVGYWLLQHFVTAAGEGVLVNRGWLSAPRERGTLPRYSTPADVVEITAKVWPQMGLPPLLEEDAWEKPWPIRVQRRDVARMAAMVGALNVELRLAAGDPGVLAPVWTEPEFGRSTHLGYAVQWFGLGTVLVVGWIVVWRKSKRGQA